MAAEERAAAYRRWIRPGSRSRRMIWSSSAIGGTVVSSKETADIQLPPAKVQQEVTLKGL